MCSCSIVCMSLCIHAPSVCICLCILLHQFAYAYVSKLHQFAYTYICRLHQFAYAYVSMLNQFTYSYASMLHQFAYSHVFVTHQLDFARSKHVYVPSACLYMCFYASSTVIYIRSLDVCNDPDIRSQLSAACPNMFVTISLSLQSR